VILPELLKAPTTFEKADLSLPIAYIGDSSLTEISGKKAYSSNHRNSGYFCNPT